MIWMILREHHSNSAISEIAVRHYRGFPEDRATIYIDEKIRKVEVITSLVREILGELGQQTKPLNGSAPKIRPVTRGRPSGFRDVVFATLRFLTASGLAQKVAPVCHTAKNVPLSWRANRRVDGLIEAILMGAGGLDEFR